MLALKEFANFINLNLANLATSYAQLLAENSELHAVIPVDQRISYARRLLKAVVEACETQNSAPLVRLFDHQNNKNFHHWVKTPTSSFYEIESLGQTLTPVVTNLEAGKFLWQTLAGVRAIFSPVSSPVSTPPVSSKDTTVDLAVYQQLEERVRFLSYLVESSQVAQVTVNQNREITYVNPYFLSLYGYQPAEVLGQPFSILIGEDNPNACVDSYFRTAAQDGVWRTEEKRKRKDGSLFPASISFTEILDEAGNIVTYLDVSRDVTERRQIDETLSQSEQRLALHVQQTPMAYIEWDLDFQVTEWNPAAERIFGFQKAEALGRHVAGLIVPVSVKDLVDQVWSDLLKQQGGTRSTNENVTQDGRVIMCEWYNTPLVDQQGQVIGVASLVQDITEQRQLEQRLESLLEQRTRQVQISTEVAQEIAAAPALDDLFQRVVNLVQQQFGYYHAHVYTLEQEDLVMRAGTGQAGHQMKEQGHIIALTAEKSLVARAARSKEPVLVPDVAQEPDWLPNPLLPETKSELAVPIRLGNTVLGVLDVQDDAVGGVGEEDRLLLQALCSQIAIVIENQRLLEQTQRRTRELTALNELGQTLATRLNMEQVLEATYRGTSRLLDVSNFSVGLYDPEKEEVTIAFTTNQSKLDRQITTLPANQGITGYIIRNRTSLLIPDNVSERLAELGIEAVGEPAQSFLGVPLIAGDQVLGRISVQNFTTPKAYNEGDRELLMAVASQAAVALQNARQFEQMQRQARREQTIREITDRLRTAPNLERLVEIAANELAQRLSVTHAKLELGIDTVSAQHRNGNILSSGNNNGH